MAEQLGFSTDQLQQLIQQVQRQQEQQQGQQQGDGEPAAAKRRRLDAAPAAGVLTLLDAAGEGPAAGGMQLSGVGREGWHEQMAPAHQASLAA